jgi:hypothetical protein
MGKKSISGVTLRRTTFYGLGSFSRIQLEYKNSKHIDDKPDAHSMTSNQSK